MKLLRYVDHQRLHIVTKDGISLSISVLLLFRHYISHKITFGAPSSGGVLRSACGAFIDSDKQNWHNISCLNLDLIAVSSSESPAFEHCKYGVSKHYAGSQGVIIARWATCFIWPYLHLEIFSENRFQQDKGQLNWLLIIVQ